MTRIDTIVLACTHFPLIRGELAATVPHAVTFIDSGEAIARQTLRVLPKDGCRSGECWRQGLALQSRPRRSRPDWSKSAGGSALDVKQESLCLKRR